MNKRVMIISIVTIVTLFIVILVSYIITGNSKLGDESGDNIVQSDLITNPVQDTNVDVYKTEYTNIAVDSLLVKEIFEFVPKYLQNSANKMSDEYMIYTAICNLEKEKVVSTNYTISGGEFPCYKADIVQEAARKIFGISINIVKKDKYNLPIGYSSEFDAFYKYPMGFGSAEEFQLVKELKENDKTYKLTIYALNVEYDINDLNHVFILTKDTFKLYLKKELNHEILRNSMKEYILNGIGLDPTPVVNEYKNELPLIEYELEKLDARGTKYFVKSIKLIVD